MPKGIPNILPQRVKHKIKQNTYLLKTFLKFYKPYLKIFLKTKTWWKYNRHQKAKIDPYQLIWVNPEDIKKANPQGKKFYKKDRFKPRIKSGDWDKRTDLFEEKRTYQSLKHRFEDQKNWESTELYQLLEESIGDCENPYSYPSDNLKEVRKLFKRIDKLYKSIKDRDYMKQSEIGPEFGNLREIQVIDQFLGPLDEVMIDIGRDGELIFEDGRHRLSIAKILEIDKIPVRILVRHKKWQQKRDLAVENPEELSEELKEHPDIKKLIEKS